MIWEVAVGKRLQQKKLIRKEILKTLKHIENDERGNQQMSSNFISTTTTAEACQETFKIQKIPLNC